MLLSMVGRYAAYCRKSDMGKVVEVLSELTNDLTEDEVKVMGLLSDHGFRLLTKTEMETPTKLKLTNAEPEEVCIYQALFFDTPFFPWEDSRFDM